MNVPKFCKDSSESCSFDDAITLTGYGKFHFEITTACCLSILVVGFQNCISSYIFPPAQCELHLTTYELGLLNVAFLAGGILSCFIWGLIADKRGRKSVLIFTHLFNALVTVAGSLSPYTGILVLCRLVNGFLTGAPASLMYAYLAEFHPVKYRFRSICFLGLFFIAGWLLLPMLAYLILPAGIEFNYKNIFVVSSWRMLLLLIAVPEIVVCLWLTRLPESPKYYVANREPKKALNILKKIYAINYNKSLDSYPVKTIILEEDNNTQCHEVIIGGKTVRIFKEISDKMKKLFRKPLLSISILISSIMFSNMFGLYGLGLWLPEFFSKFQRYQTLHPTSSVSIQKLATISLVTNNTCRPSFDHSVFISTIATGTTAFVVNGVSCLISTVVSSRSITIVLTFLGGVCAGCTYWLTTSLQYLAVSCVFQAAMMTANMSITSIIIEQFPTGVAGIAVSLVMCSGRLGAAISNVVFAYYIDDHCEIPIFTVAFTELAGGILCLLVPGDKTNRSADNDEDKKIERPVFSEKISEF